MDESHHYRAEKGAQALNDLHPLLGLELTATPLVTKGAKQVPFKNVVYEYPLPKAIEDGYTRTPFAVTRSDIDFYNFGDEQLDKLMLLDGISCHEKAKRKLEVYAVNHSTPEKPVRTVKPFMLVVCKDTDHAAWVERFIKSNEFRGGAYRNKTITVHSKQKGAETEFNTRLLLGVEEPDNPIEIVIHVNMLKEGWDVNNLYTIVPLRTAASKILREQMVGRGLRLPYGERTGDRDVDAVMLTAHDKFNDILAEAQKGDSIFKAGNVIKAEDLDEPEEIAYTQLTFDDKPDQGLQRAYERTGVTESEENDALLQTAKVYLQEKTEEYISASPTPAAPTQPDKQKIVQAVKAKIEEDQDLGKTFKDNENPFLAWLEEETEQVYNTIIGKYIPIPRIRVTDAGVEEYVFLDFDLNLIEFTHVPIKNELLIQNLEDMNDRQRIKGDAIDFEGYNPQKVILAELRKKPEIDYERCSTLLFKLIMQVCDHYESAYGTNGMQNIVMMYRRDLANKIEGIRRGVFAEAKFDSKEGELTLARVLDRDEDVLKWLRPAPYEFNITYNRGKRYEPDFVVETADCCYLIEVKAEKDMGDPDVIAKKKRGIQYCEVATRWCKANGYKPWKYLFIPSKQVLANSSFARLEERFQEH